MWKQQNQLYWGLVLSILCFGGFYDWAAVLLGAAVCVMGIVRITKTGKALIIKEKWIWLLLLQEICLIVGMITAIDRGMNFVGVLRFLPVIVWIFLIMQYSEEERRSALEVVPHMGCFMIGIGLVALVIPGMSEWFWSAERLGGFFQYSNTCAVFFLLGLMLLKDRDTKSSKIQWMILFWGILLTGSRTVMLLLATVFVIDLFDKKLAKSHKQLMIGNVLTAVLAAIAVVFFTGSFQNLARLATLFSSNSTFYGRLLYWKDAIAIILKHPLGLGWRGYEYIQPAVQTGVYSTMYVHNDLLQSFLDGGWLSGAALAGLMLWQLRCSSYRLPLAVLLLHSMVDINLQYPAVWFTILLMFDFGKEHCSLNKEKRMESRIYLGVVALLCIYFLFPFGAEYLGKCDAAVYLYPAYTQAKEELLAGTGDAEEAVRLADEILEQNEYSSLAYDAKALAAYASGDTEEFTNYKERVLKIEKYDISHYQDYAYLLEGLKEYAIMEGNDKVKQYCEIKCAQIPGMLKTVEEQTSALAWKLRDQPVFSMEELEKTQ